MDKDTIKGTIKEVGGEARAAIGKATGDTEGQARGNADAVSGNLQKNFGKLKDSLD